jgi:hypothetical protein
MHDAGLSLERIGDNVGHGSTYMTDGTATCWRMLDEYLARGNTAGRIEQMTEHRDDR